MASYDESDGDSNNQPLELVSGLTFASWDGFKKWLDRFALKEGFNYKIRTSEKEQGILRRVAYECTKFGLHNPQITSDSTKRSLRFHKLIPKMLEDIEKYVNQGRMDFRSIFPLLRHDYPDQPIYKKTYTTQLDPISRKLSSLFWISPVQRELYSKYNDIIILDTTYNNTNRFQMMLCILTVIDNNYKTRIMASAIIEDETLDTYRWIFDIILTETGVYSKVIFTDSDPLMIHSIKEIYPNT
ncbi:unnamed protein product [Rhizophagus irregularis]|nr:unnamed protein product [Rhizophagus irregularis]